DPAQALPEVSTELNTIQRLLSQTGGNAETIWQATPDILEEHFDTQRDELRLFHYSGHASPGGLQLNRDGQASRIAFSGGIARQAGWARDLRLVFLNGCSTRDQVQVFLDQGAAAVIATSKPLIDAYAVDFARRFYQSFTRRNGRNTLRQAFDAAFISFTDDHGNLSRSMLDEQVRGSIDLDEDANEPLYELHLHPQKGAVADQLFATWFETAPTNGTPAPSTANPSPVPNDAAGLKAKIEDFISKGQIEAALDELTKINADAILLKGKYTAAKRENNMGLLAGDEWRRTLAQINYAVLEMVRGL
ncbi:MAG: CHAT domain-containing protein, partial [Saprospiraceae bacterium]